MALAQILPRRGTSAQWIASNPVLANGEIGYDSTLKRMKIGDGNTVWSGLPWATADGATIQRLEELAREITGAVAPTDAFVASAINNPQSATKQALDATIGGAVGEVGGALFAPTDIAGSSFAKVRSKLDADLENVVIGVVGDSTGARVSAANPRWVTKLAERLATMYPTKTVVIYQWNVAANAYDAPVTLRTGSGSRTITVYNGSASGQNTTYSQAHLLSMLPVACDLVFVNHGHNMVGNDDTEASEKFYALGRDILRWSSPAGSLVFVSQNPRTSPATGNGEHRTRLNKMSSVCASNGWGLINITQAFLDTPGWATAFFDPADGTHPNDAGEEAWASYIWSLFTNPRIKYAAPLAAPSARDRIFIPATQMFPTLVANGSPTMEALAGWPLMEFANSASAIEAAGIAEIPYSWQKVNVWLYWTVHVAGAGGNVVWEMYYSNSSRIGTEQSSAVTTTALNNQQTPSAGAAHAVPSVNYGEAHTVLLRNATLAPAAVKDTSRVVSIRVRRLGQHASDTFPDPVNVIGIMIERAL